MSRATRVASPQSPSRALDLAPREQQSACRAMICDQARRVLVAHYGPRLEAIILTGSLARDEATVLRDEDGWKLASDADFLLIFRRRGQIPSAAELEQARAEIEGQLVRHGLRCALTLGAAGPDYLHRLPPSIFAYELRICGHVAWGDSQILVEIPPFAASTIPLEDAWRLLCNRLVELLPVIHEGLGAESSLSDEARYRAVKLCLDTATSFSVFAGIYQPSYRARAEAIRAHAERGLDSQWPIPLGCFALDVATCTDWKLNGRAVAVGADVAFLRRAIESARSLSRWELARMTGLPAHLSESVLLDTWAGLQPLGQRLRGWLHVGRRMGGLRSWPHWRRWSSQAHRTSPRHAVYGAMTVLMSAVADEMDHRASGPSAGSMRHVIDRSLPMPDNPDADGKLTGWEPMSARVLWNYHQFLVDTRA